MDYRENNKGFITASKLKLFLDSPLLYKAVYIDEVDLSDVKKSTALEIGTMVDKYLLTPNEFNEEYAFPVAGLKADLVSYCESKGIELSGREKVDDLKALIYGTKKVLTDVQSQIVNGIDAEVHRQPLWDSETPYETQKDLFGEYNGLKIKGTLDRFHIDEEGNVTIRDLKTTSSMYYNNYSGNTQFYADLATRDTYHYKLQMAMYVWLVKQNYDNVKSITVIIDAIGTTDPYFYQAIKFDTQELEDLWDTLIDPLLNSIKMMDTGMQMVVEPNSRNKLCANWYYKLGTDDCIQKEYETIPPVVNDMSTVIEDNTDEFDWDTL